MNDVKREAVRSAVVEGLEKEITSPYPCFPVLLRVNQIFSNTNDSLFPFSWLVEIHRLANPLRGREFWEFRLFTWLFLLELLETEEEGTNYHES